MIKQIPTSLFVQRSACKLWRRQYHWFCKWRILPWQGNSIPIVLHHFHNTPSSKNWWRFTVPEMFHICYHCLHSTDPESMRRPCASSLLATNHPLPAGDILSPTEAIVSCIFINRVLINLWYNLCTNIETMSMMLLLKGVFVEII